MARLVDLGGGWLVGFFAKRQVTARVSELAWARVVQLEQARWEAGRGFSYPSMQVRNVQQRTETYWETVYDMQPGAPGPNGVPGPSTPVPRQQLRSRRYYTYEALAWYASRKLSESGTGSDEVRWPDCNLGPEERVRSRKETYQVTFEAAGKTYRKVLPEQEWRDLEPGGSCQLSLGLFGGVKKVVPARLLTRPR